MITVTNLTADELIIAETLFQPNETHELTNAQAVSWSFKDDVVDAIVTGKIQVSVFDIPQDTYLKQIRALAHANLYL